MGGSPDGAFGGLVPGPPARGGAARAGGACGASAGAFAPYGPVGADRAPGAADPLDGVADWGPINTAAGVLQLVPV
ncbi:hypothetical protein E1283_12650, partial [Streptomyces hainanensis]